MPAPVEGAAAAACVPDVPALLLVAEPPDELVELAPVFAAEPDEVDALDSEVVLDDLVADFALAVDDVDFAKLVLAAIDEVAEETEEAEEAEDATVMLLVADALPLGVIDSTVFELSTTKGAL